MHRITIDSVSQTLLLYTTQQNVSEAVMECTLNCCSCYLTGFQHFLFVTRLKSFNNWLPHFRCSTRHGCETVIASRNLEKLKEVVPASVILNSIAATKVLTPSCDICPLRQPKSCLLCQDADVCLCVWMWGSRRASQPLWRRRWKNLAKSTFLLTVRELDAVARRFFALQFHFQRHV